MYLRFAVNIIDIPSYSTMKRKAAKNAIKKLNTSNQKKKKKLSSTVQKKKLNKLRRSGLLNTKSTRSLSKSKERHRSESETSNSDVESACPAKKAKTEVKKKVQPPSRRSSSNTVKDEGDGEIYAFVKIMNESDYDSD